MIDITCECENDHKEIVEVTDDAGVTSWKLADRCTACLEDVCLYQDEVSEVGSRTNS